MSVTSPFPQGRSTPPPLPSPVAHGRDHAGSTSRPRAARRASSAVFTAADIPGENQIGNIIQDEPLLAADEVDYVGQPVALVVADSLDAGPRRPGPDRPRDRAASARLRSAGSLPRGELIGAAAHVRHGRRGRRPGRVAASWSTAAPIPAARSTSISRRRRLSPFPRDDGGVQVYSATQSPTVVQRTVARVLGLAMHQVEVDVPRLGGAFGGKEDQATAWAALAALAALPAAAGRSSSS